MSGHSINNLLLPIHGLLNTYVIAPDGLLITVARPNVNWPDIAGALPI